MQKQEKVPQEAGRSTLNVAVRDPVAGGLLDEEQKASGRRKPRVFFDDSADTSHLSDARHRRASQCPNED